MNVSKELLDHLLKKAETEDRWKVNEAEFIAQQLNRYDAFANDRIRFERERQNARDICKKNIALIDEKEKKNQQTCDHPLSTYHADASGNNDSWRECNICGAEIQRRSGQTPSYDG